MSVIDDFINLYDKQYDFFDNYSKMVAVKVEEQLFKKAVKAVVTYRPKNTASLREKIEKNNRKRKYHSVTDIANDIKDLSGVRVSLYFPLPIFIINEMMNDAFIVLEKHELLTANQNPIYRNRYPGYHAGHYHVKLKEKNVPGRFLNTTAEIQVASTLMHAWAEIDHDLVYKPSYGNPSIKELAMLDEVNGLALSAEMSLKSLQHAMAERTIKSGSANDKYELANLLLMNIDKDQFKKNRLGDVYLLQYYLETLGRTGFSQLLVLIEKINPGSPESITDQLLYMLLEKNYHPVKMNLRAYFKKLHFLSKEISVADEFIGLWIAIEKNIKEIPDYAAFKTGQFVTPPFNMPEQKEILTAAETAMIENLYVVKNNVLHGGQTISTSYISNCLVALKAISVKIVGRNKKIGKSQSSGR